MFLKSGMAPQSFKTIEQVATAIVAGQEVGLKPWQSLQSIAVINGRPSLWGDSLPALVRASGACRRITETLDEAGEGATAICEAELSSGEVVRRTFSIDDAKAAGLWKKAGPWSQYPKRMLQMRARAFCLRDAFPHVLRGMHVAEESMDIPALPSEHGKAVMVLGELK